MLFISEDNSYKSFLNSSIVRPASFTIPAIEKKLAGFALGMVIIHSPFVIVLCLPSLAIQKPALSNALTAL
jgi:hypothetical protein